MELNLSPSGVAPVVFAVVATSWVLMLAFYLWVQRVALVAMNKKIALAHIKISQLEALRKLSSLQEKL